MDLSKFKTPDWLVIGGGLAVLIGGFLKWFTVDGFSGGPNAFDYTLTGLIPWILLVGAAVITFLLAAGIVARGNTPWSLIVLGATALGALLIVIRVLMGEDDPFERSAGLWLSALGAIVAAVGAFLAFQASGGNVRDLTDMDKMKSAFK